MEDIKKIIQILTNDIELGQLLLESQEISFRDLLKELLTTKDRYYLQPFTHYKNKFKIRYHQFSHFTQGYEVITQHVLYIGSLSVSISDGDIDYENVYANQYRISMDFTRQDTTYNVEDALDIIESLLKPYEL